LSDAFSLPLTQDGSGRFDQYEYAEVGMGSDKIAAATHFIPLPIAEMAKAERRLFFLD
jgi:hypothetical protein